MEGEIAKILLEVGAVTLSPNKPYIFTSGLKTPIYCDNRYLIGCVKEREVVVKAFLDILKNLEFDVVGGTSTAGIPWAAWIAKELSKPMVYIRGSAKGHGKQKLVEGKFKEGDKIVIIEDLISTGGSSISAIEAVRNEGGVVNDLVAIFTYEFANALPKFEELMCNVLTLSNFSTLVSVATEMNKITSKEKEVVLQWNKDPENWAKNNGLE